MLPSLVNLALAELVLQINLIYVGKLNDVEMLAGVGLASTLICAIPLSLTLGISGVLETLVSQAYGRK